VHCLHCGAGMELAALFCGECGRPVARPVTAAATPVRAAPPPAPAARASCTAAVLVALAVVAVGFGGWRAWQWWNGGAGSTGAPAGAAAGTITADSPAQPAASPAPAASAGAPEQEVHQAPAVPYKAPTVTYEAPQPQPLPREFDLPRLPASAVITRGEPQPTQIAAPAAATPADRPPPQRVEIFRPDPSPPPASRPPLEPPPAPPGRVAYSGQGSGVINWSGKIDKNETVSIDGGQASAGTVLQGALPGVPVMLDIDHAEFALAEVPAPSNGWSRLRIRSRNRRHTVITIRWTVIQ